MLECQKELFQLDPEYTYLNCAYMSPIMRQVEEAGVIGIQGKRNPFNVSPSDFFEPTEKLRGLFARLINCKKSEQTFIIPSVSYGIASVANNIRLSDGDNIIVVDEQFPSNYYTWQRLCDQHNAHLNIIKAPASDLRGAEWNQKILEAINEKTRVVALPHVHWADGTLFDLIAIRERASEVSAKLIIDGTQSVGALTFDVERIQPDALICAGYKWLLGPYSIGMAYFSEGFNDGVPIEENWINRHKSEDFTGLVNYENRYQRGALRYEVGEHSNFILVPMLIKALEQLLEWNVENIQSYCQQLFSTGIEELRSHGYRIESSEFRANHLFGIRVGKSHSLEDLKNKLTEAKISVSYRGDAIRVSPHLYNQASEVDHFVKILTQ